MPTLYRHPRIWTGDPNHPWVTSLLVDGERVVATGDVDETVDLPGELVIPGLHDAHIHTGWMARSMADVDLRPTRSLDEALVRIEAHAAARPAGEWLFGGWWDMNLWSPSVWPDRWALDAVSGDHPIALSSRDGHSMWANSAALQAVGITRDTVDPDGGAIDRTPSGDPTGLLREAAGRGLEALQTTDLGGDLSVLLPRLQEHLLSLGVTAVTDIDGEDVRAAYLAMAAAGALNIRVVKCLPTTALEVAIADGRRTGDGDDWVRTGPMKIFSDGALGSHSCDMHRGFHGDEDNQGIEVTDSDLLWQLASRATDHGIALTTHAIGDRANTRVLDVYERLRDEGVTLPLRIEHAQHLRPDDVPRFASLNVIASVQPTHATSDMDLADDLLSGHDVLQYPTRTLLDAGALVAFGTDAPVELPDPMATLYAAVTRQRPDGTPPGGWHPEERITLEQALSAHTTGSWLAAGGFTAAGRLTEGQLADFVALDTDVFAADSPSAISRARAVRTVVGGVTRWSAAGDQGASSSKS
ncbi:amidohydrolase [Branchiibius cervicis]|uniref:Amidohydrolase n=1 Tax=Branchiibius cervicis TaxID=908252 RepID=A0ABW2AZ27_9MICO